MIKLFIIGLLLSTVNALVVGNYHIRIHRLVDASEVLTISSDTVTFNFYLDTTQLGEDIIWLDLSGYPVTLYLEYSYGIIGPYPIMNPNKVTPYTEISFVDETGLWRKVNFRRGWNILTRGKYNLLSDPLLYSANVAHGVLQTGTGGFVQGYFPNCDSDYGLNIIYVNTNHITDVTKNTLSCDYVSCSSYYSSSTQISPSYNPGVFDYVANATDGGPYWPNRVTGLSTLPFLQVTAICYNDGGVNNIYYAKNPRFSTPLDLFVIKHSNNYPVTSGKTSIPQNTFNPPQSQSSQASIDMDKSYPYAIFNDAL